MLLSRESQSLKVWDEFIHVLASRDEIANICIKDRGKEKMPKKMHSERPA